MPHNLNGTTYNLALLDTNVVSEACKRSEPERARLLEHLANRRLLPCYGVQTILEIMRSTDLYPRFIECFGILPSIIVKTWDLLVDSEIDAYWEGQADALIASVWGLRGTGSNDPRERLRILIEAAGLEEKRLQWEREVPSILAGLLEQRDALGRIGDATASQKRKAIEAACLRHLRGLRPAFMAQLSMRGETCDISRFPSLKMMTYAILHKFYLDDRKAAASDVVDILLATAIPYVDEVYLERNHANIVRQTQRLDPFVEHVKVYTLGDLRRPLGSD